MCLKNIYIPGNVCFQSFEVPCITCLQISQSDMEETVQVATGTTVLYQINPSEKRTDQGRENKAIIVTSDEDITIHTINAVPFSLDGTLAVPLTPSGMRFYVISYTPYNNMTSQFTVAAAYNNTQVEIYLKAPDGR